MDLIVTTQARDAEDELRSFHTWLLDDSYVRRNAKVALQGRGPAVGRIGGVGVGVGGTLEGIRIALDSGFRLANLALAWLAWRAARSSAPDMTFEHDGVTVTLSGQDVETATRVLEALRPTDR
ncbi:hypothetical protein PV410_20110 [Streptomyces sp. PA03-5A]|nr:hypothetical protein [Streptomyces sp. PA03-5A]